MTVYLAWAVVNVAALAGAVVLVLYDRWQWWVLMLIPLFSSAKSSRKDDATGPATPDGSKP